VSSWSYNSWGMGMQESGSAVIRDTGRVAVLGTYLLLVL